MTTQQPIAFILRIITARADRHVVAIAEDEESAISQASTANPDAFEIIPENELPLVSDRHSIDPELLMRVAYEVMKWGDEEVAKAAAARDRQRVLAVMDQTNKLAALLAADIEKLTKSNQPA